MPTLDWIGKGAVLNHHKTVPFHLLEEDPALSVGEVDSGNLLIQGDNLLALKALLPYYAGQVKCIYIDPPYNTGNEGWVYNDNVNSPEMRAWLGKVVGGEAEDLSRHDKWLCMMYPRLMMLREMLREDGVLFISIDDNEVGNLNLLLDEIFGKKCFMAKLIWKSRQYLDSRALTGISTDHEYIFVYAKSSGNVRLKGKDRDLSKYSNPDDDSRGPWMSRSILGLANKMQRPNLHYDLVDPLTQNSYPCPPNTGWRYNQETIRGKIAEGRILFPKSKSGRPREKVFLKELQTENPGFPSVIDDIFTAEGSHQIRQILGAQVFAFPKPTNLVKELIRQSSNPGDIIMDSFAGSGTTGDAVFQSNKEGNSNLHFVLVEMDENIATNITAERLRRVSQGYDWKDQKGNLRHEEGLGGGFRFCRLSKTLLNENGQIDLRVTFLDLARHVFFLATGSPLSAQYPGGSEFLGSHNGTGVYLLYNGILKDKDPEGGNILTPRILVGLPPHPGPRIVFANGTTLSESTLSRLNLTVRQLPYDLQAD